MERKDKIPKGSGSHDFPDTSLKVFLFMITTDKVVLDIADASLQYVGHMSNVELASGLDRYSACNRAAGKRLNDVRKVRIRVRF